MSLPVIRSRLSTSAASFHDCQRLLCSATSIPKDPSLPSSSAAIYAGAASSSQQHPSATSPPTLPPSSGSSLLKFLQYTLIGAFTGAAATAGYATYAYTLDEVDEKAKAFRASANSVVDDESTVDKIKASVQSTAMKACAGAIDSYLDIRRMIEEHVWIYGIDAASGAAVKALDISPGDHVLDLCAASGAKLCMLLNILGDSGSVTGVDVATHRLAECRRMVRKYGIGGRCRLFVADGAKFSLLPSPVTSVSKLCEFSVEPTYKEWSSRKPWEERKLPAKAREGSSVTSTSAVLEPELIFYGQHAGVVGCTKDEIYRIANSNESSCCGYDKVLVNAECTHDGSIKHVQKFENWGWEMLWRRVLDAERTDDLTMLQFRLLTNGFRLLKVGGFLVYSTCSLTVAQNEEVVQKFLSENPSAELQEIKNSRDWACKSGRIPKTLRFDPLTSQTSGLFIAKFTKLQVDS